jgi:hypothetical protein
MKNLILMGALLLLSVVSCKKKCDCGIVKSVYPDPDMSPNGWLQIPNNTYYITHYVRKENLCTGIIVTDTIWNVSCIISTGISKKWIPLQPLPQIGTKYCRKY